MGQDFYQKYHVSKEIFDELEDILGRRIIDLIFRGENFELSQTENSQPAIMTTSIAILKALEYENILSLDSFQAVAGHSLGEYSALVANRGLKFKDSAKLLKIRSKAMQECMPLGTGGMIAIIGCNKEYIDDVLIEASEYGSIYIANDNAEGQIVLSGEIKPIEFISANSKNLNIRKAVKLPSAPFHCALMSQASEILGTEIRKTQFNQFEVPLYSNVTSHTCNEIEIPNLLIDQVVKKVRWREIIENMVADGFNKFIEIGPGNVLTNLVKRISRNVDVYSVNKISDLEKLEI